jgi:hypothetical protein
VVGGGGGGHLNSTNALYVSVGCFPQYTWRKHNWLCVRFCSVCMGSYAPGFVCAEVFIAFFVVYFVFLYMIYTGRLKFMFKRTLCCMVGNKSDNTI